MYYDIDVGEKTFNVRPIAICVPNKDSTQHTFVTRVWNFASECKSVGAVDLRPTLANINIAALKIAPAKGKRRCWLRLGVEVGLDITFIVSWRSDGRKVNDISSVCISKLVIGAATEGGGGGGRWWCFRPI